jgi:phosphatidylglycerophosphate synthase
VDVYLLRFTKQALPLFYATGHTPNVLTFYGLVLRLLAAFALTKASLGLFICFWLLGYLFDCMDGQFARMYKMTSDFGDFFDHMSDLVVHIVLIVVVYWRYRTPWVTLGGLLLFLILMLMHMGCQQHLLEHERGPVPVQVRHPVLRF